MCCDVCSGYVECEEKNRLKEKCCKQCPEYEYCYGVEPCDDNEKEDY